MSDFVAVIRFSYPEQDTCQSGEIRFSADDRPAADKLLNGPDEAMSERLDQLAESLGYDAERAEYDVWELNEVEPEREEDDYATEDYRTWYQYGKVVLQLGEDDDWKAAIREHMLVCNFFPNVWFISDHGNEHLLSVLDD